MRHATGVMGLMGFSICGWGRKAAEVEGDLYRNYDRINLGVSREFLVQMRRKAQNYEQRNSPATQFFKGSCKQSLNQGSRALHCILFVNE